MNYINFYQNYLINNSDDSNTVDTKELVNEIFDLYKQDVISEKSFKFFIEILFTSFIENKFNEKYLPKIFELDDKMTNSLLKLGKNYGRR